MIQESVPSRASKRIRTSEDPTTQPSKPRQALIDVLSPCGWPCPRLLAFAIPCSLTPVESCTVTRVLRSDPQSCRGQTHVVAEPLAQQIAKCSLRNRKQITQSGAKSTCCGHCLLHPLFVDLDRSFKTLQTLHSKGVTGNVTEITVIIIGFAASQSRAGTSMRNRSGLQVCASERISRQEPRAEVIDGY